ncbi:MAG: DUF2110 family protein [Candidatus Bathyarchaeia archaeon]
MKLTLAEKLFSRMNKELLINELNQKLKEISSKINVNYRIVGFNEKNWIKIEINGEDVEVFQELIKLKFGLAKTDLKELRIGDICKGFIVNSGKIDYGLYVDIGLIYPISNNAFYPLSTARSQLAYGKQLPMKEIINMYCLYDGFPLKVRITFIDYLRGNVEVELLGSQEDSLKNMINSYFERILIFDVFEKQILKVLRLTDVEKYIASIEQLSLSTFMLVCKLGINSQDIISRINSQLKNSRIYALKPSINKFKV